MPSVGLSKSDFKRVFGEPDPIDSTGPGRHRLCKVTGQWFKLGENPHNLPRVSKRNADLAAPQLAPTFEPFKASVHPDAPVIGSRNDKRDYMDRHDLTEYEPGVRNEAAQWSRELDNKRDIEETIQRFDQTDTDYWTPEQKGDVAPTEALGTDGKDVDTTTAEVIDSGG